MIERGLFKIGKKIRLERLYYEELKMVYIEDTTLLFVLEGDIDILIDGKIIKILDGELFLVNAREMVGIEASKSNLVLIVELESTRELLPGRKIRLDRPMSIFYYQDLYEEMTGLLALLYLETVEVKEGHEAFTSGYLDQLYGLILRFLPLELKNQSAENQVISDRMIEVMTYLNQHYQEEINLDKVSEAFHLSKYYLSHSFKKQVGTTIGKYLEEVRLLNAIQTLAHTNETVTDIAYANGFASTRAFVESFKKKRGLTPTQYRKEDKGTIPNEKQPDSGRDYLELFSKYIKPRNENVYARMEVVEKELDLEKQSYPHYQSHVILKMFRENQEDKLELLTGKTQQQFISVDQVIDKIMIENSIGESSLDFAALEKELDLLMKHQLTPYLQISVFDYERYQQKQSSLSFKEIMRRLKYFLESQYFSLIGWRLEFRPYYEYEGTGELCQPIREVIELFKDSCSLVIHMPKHPRSVENHTTESVMVEVIDDFTRVKNFPLSTVLKELNHPENLEYIQENQNMVYQGKILKHLEKLGEDAYYQQFDQLIYANLMVWLSFYFMDNVNQKFITPLTLDGKPMFYYFEEKLAQKLALISPNGLYTDSWYSFQFMSKLYGEVVFKNDYCLVTRRGEHYRMLFIHSNDFMDNLARLREDKEPKVGYKQPTALIRLHLKGLNGSYRITKEEMTPSMRLTQKKQIKIESNVKLLKEDVDYLNQIRQPFRQVKNVNIGEDFVIEEEIPLLGVLFVEMRKTK